MSDHITLRQAQGTYAVRAAGAVLGESANAMELIENGHAPVIYIPRADLAMAFFDKTDHSTTCPHKGQASYFTIEAKSGPIKNAAWSYESPINGMEPIAGHLAFYTDKVTVEAL
jgi:uncharacterized protein (DUF427 family)